MTHDRHERIRDIFIGALEVPPDERSAFLKKACGEDAQLRADVLKLIGADQADSRLRWGVSTEIAIPRFALGSVLANRFKLTRFIAAGGMGDVYEANDLELEERVALKTIRPDVVRDAGSLARFKREVQYAKRVTHPNVCRIHDIATHRQDESEIVFLTMELLDGVTLGSRLDSDGPMSVASAFPVVAQMAEALGAIHDAGIVHRDFKTSNVMLVTAGKVVVTDFGVAYSTSAGKALTETGRIVGTPAYMAPEQLTGGELTPATDVYALGLVMYEMVAGRSPFRGNTPGDEALQRLREPPVSPRSHVPGLSVRWERTILRCLEREPARRFQSPREVVKALAESGNWKAATATSRLPDFSRRAWLAVLMSIVALGSAGFFARERWTSAPGEPKGEALRWYDEGLSALRDGTYFKASKALQRAVELAPHSVLAHARLAEAWTQLDSLDRAREEMLKANPPGAAVHLAAIDELRLEAIHLAMTKDYAGAIARYQEIVKRASSAELPGAYLDLGEAYERAEKPKEAIQNYQEAARRDPSYAAAFLRMGVLHARAQETAQAEASFAQAESIYQSLSNREGVIEVALDRAHAAEWIGHLQEASELASKSVEMARGAGVVNQQISCLLGLAGIQFAMDQPAEGQKSATEAVNLAKSNGLENLAARALLQLGNAALLKGNIAEAKANFANAIEFAVRTKQVLVEMQARFSLASALSQEDNAIEAANELEPALAFFQQNGFRAPAMQSMLLLARAKRDSGDFDGALRAAYELRDASKSGNRLQMFWAEDVIGSILSRRQHFSEALTHFEQARAMAEEGGDEMHLGYELFDIGDQLANLGHYDEARKALDRSLEIATTSGLSKSLKVDIQLTLAKMALSRLDTREAQVKVSEALAAGSESKGVPIEGKCILALTEHLGGGKSKAAYDVDEALRLAENSKNGSMISEVLLAAATIRLDSELAREAFDMAQRAGEMFDRSGQMESEWRAWLIGARAAGALGDKAESKELAGRASQTLARMENSWPEQDFKAYLARPDIQRLRKQLSAL